MPHSFPKRISKLDVQTKIEHMAYLEDVDECGQLSDSSSLSEDEESLDLKRQLAKADAENRKLKKMLRKSELKRKLLEGQRDIEDLKGHISKVKTSTFHAKVKDMKTKFDSPFRENEIPESIHETLRSEQENRVVEGNGRPLLECLSHTIGLKLDQQCKYINVNANSEQGQGSKMEMYTDPDYLHEKVVALLSTHKTKFMPVLPLLCDNIPTAAKPDGQGKRKDQEKHLETFYDTVVTDCKCKETYQSYAMLCLYAAATCLYTPLYILIDNQIGKSQWAYYQPLYEHADQPVGFHYLTMFMSSHGKFYTIQSNDWTARRPIARGMVGMFLSMLNDMPVTGINVPDELKNLPADHKTKLCTELTEDIVLQCCDLFLNQNLIQKKDFERMTAHRAKRPDFTRFVQNTPDAFIIVCQVLLKRRERKYIKPYISDWCVVVRESDFIAKCDALVGLDNAGVEKNNSVSGFVNNCTIGGAELDERRKKINITVIGSSAGGIVSGGLVITGLALAPISFGTSLGLSIAGGAIGVGTGFASGAARAIEAVKQNRKLETINITSEEIQHLEQNMALEFQKVETCFETNIEKTGMIGAECPGMSLRGFLAVGSVFRASHSAVAIALAAAKLGGTAATLAASVLGPFSIAFDIAFLAEAAHNKIKGNKTNAGELLRVMADTVRINSKIINDILRGNQAEDKRIVEWK